MIITTDPWITLVLNGSIHGAISCVPNNKTHLMLIGNEHPGPEGRPVRYSPLDPSMMPNEDDQSEFAKVFRVIRTLVEQGVLKGPYGEDHPAVYARFEYAVPELSPAQVLATLESAGPWVYIDSITYGNRIESFKSERDAKLTAIEQSIHGEYGRWMDDKTELTLPEVIIVKTEGEKAEASQVARERYDQIMQERDQPSLLARVWTKFGNWLFN